MKHMLAIWSLSLLDFYLINVTFNINKHFYEQKAHSSNINRENICTVRLHRSTVSERSVPGEMSPAARSSSSEASVSALSSSQEEEGRPRPKCPARHANQSFLSSRPQESCPLTKFQTRSTKSKGHG